jgi:hypothetical protein
MKKILVFCCLFFVTVSEAQKKLIPTTESAVTGIDLPVGSKQDGRVLSQSMAGFLMETESAKRSTTLRTAEVLVLPPVTLSKFNMDSLVKQLSTRNWKTIATEGDNYLWLQKDKSFVIAYVSIDTKAFNLYFAETTSPPVFNTRAEDSTGDQPVVQPIPNQQEIIEQPAVSPNATINSSIVGTWRRGTSITMYGGRWSSTGYQYIFNANGTYTYVIKTYLEDDPETLLTRESGIFTISGNTITLDPKTNVIEAWSKSNGGDNYKALITTQKKPLEKIAYQFTIQFIPELKETGLILLYGNETARDGKYNSIAFPNGWRFSPAGPDYKPIKLPGE